MTKDKKAIIKKNQCDKSPFCAAKRVCPVEAITQKRKLIFQTETPEIDQDKCIGCGKCVKYCPHGAIKMV